MLLQSRQGVVREALACPLKSVRVVKSTSAQRVMVSRRATVRVAARIKVEPFVGANCYYLLVSWCVDEEHMKSPLVTSCRCTRSAASFPY